MAEEPLAEGAVVGAVVEAEVEEAAP